MEKSAQEIIAVMKNETIDYKYMKKIRAREARNLLENILNSIQKQREMAGHYAMVKKGYISASEYPSWAYAIAYRLYDPENRYSDDGKARLFNLCRKLIAEFGTKAPFFAKQLVHNQDAPRYLAQAASDLLFE